MRALSFILVLTALAGCRIDPPGHGDVFAANQILFEYDGKELKPNLDASNSEQERALVLLEQAMAVGHPYASSHKAFAVMIHEGNLAAEPHFRAVVEDANTTQRHRDQAYSMLSHIAAARPMLEAGLKWNDISHGEHLKWADVPGQFAVLREASAAGSAVADSFMSHRVETLRAQATAGNADADSLLALVGLADA